MSQQSRHVSAHIDRPAGDVYDYASDPANLPAWAQGLSRSVEVIDGKLHVESPSGPVVVEFAPRNEFGVLDHTVTGPDGDAGYNPMRVTPDGAGSEVVFSVRRRPGMTDDEFARDAGLVQADLDRLKQILES